jgi:hypothetical protein
MVRRTGWHTLPDGRTCYVLGDGRTVPDGAGVRLVGIRSQVTRASRPVGGSVGDDELRAALASIASHGWGPILGLAVGVRALAQTIAPVRCSLVTTGEPNTGKTLTLSLALGVVMTSGWPPLTDAGFSDTLNAMEGKIGQASDRAIGLDDLAVTSYSNSIELRDATAKFDRITRAFANDEPVRDRMTREMGLRESVTVRGIPVITAQRIPATVQASSIRRVVVADFLRGDNDWRWYREHSRTLDAALRAIGERVIAALFEGGADAERWVIECDEHAGRLLAPHVDAAISAPPDGMDGVVKGAAQMVGGLLMLAGATGQDADALCSAVLHPLAASLARQADAMTDRQAADSGTREALGEVLRAALYARRAHVRDPRQDVPADIVPGQTAQAQGLREDLAQGVRTGGFSGEGASLWYLADRRLIGITSADLHALVTAAREPRLAGYTPRSLPAWLLREGVTVPSTQKGPRATERHQIGSGAKSPVHRLVLVPAGTVFELPDDGQDDDDRDGGPDVPETPATPPAPPRPAPPRPATLLDETNAVDADERLADVRPIRRRQPREVPTVARRVLAVREGTAVDPMTGETIELSDVARHELPALLDAVADVADDVTLILGPDMRAVYGLPAKPVKVTVKWHKAYAPVVDAGWHRPGGEPGERPRVGPVTAFARTGRDGIVRVMVSEWLGKDMFPRVKDHDDPVDVLAYRVARFTEVTGWTYTGTPAGTAIRELRAGIERTARRHPRWQGQRDVWPEVETVTTWERSMTDAERAAGWVHTYDGHRNYLASYGAAIVAADDLEHDTAPVLDLKRAGLWRVTVPSWPRADVPAPVLGAAPGESAWVTTATLRLYDELSIAVDVHEAWTAPAVNLQGFRDWGEHVRDVLTSLDSSSDPDDLAVRGAVKFMYQALHGKLRDVDQRTIARPDWGYAVRDAAWTGVLRKAYRAAGLLPDRHGVTADEPRTPLYLDTDELAYADDHDDHMARVPFGIVVREPAEVKLGQFKHKHTKTTTEWEATDRG